MKWMPELGQDRELDSFQVPSHWLLVIQALIINVRDDQQKKLVKLETFLILEVNQRVQQHSVNLNQMLLVINIKTQENTS